MVGRDHERAFKVNLTTRQEEKSILFREIVFIGNWRGNTNARIHTN
jgi:hypothetical protein